MITSNAPNHVHATGCLRVRCPGCGDVANILVEIANNWEGLPCFRISAADDPMHNTRVEIVDGVTIPFFWCEACQL